MNKNKTISQSFEFRGDKLILTTKEVTEEEVKDTGMIILAYYPNEKPEDKHIIYKLTCMRLGRLPDDQANYQYKWFWGAIWNSSGQIGESYDTMKQAIEYMQGRPYGHIAKMVKTHATEIYNFEKIFEVK